MKYINQEYIQDILEKAKVSRLITVDEILQKACRLKGLSLQEAAVLLSVQSDNELEKIFAAAAWIKQAIYGKRIVLFAPLYISNLCSNGCLYCGFKADNAITQRKKLNSGEISEQVRMILGVGHKRILMVCGEYAQEKNIDYYVDAMKTIYSASVGPQRVRRVNVNCAPLTVDEFRRLKEAGIGTYQIFQETYHEQTYRAVHPYGPKSDPDNRLDAIVRAFEAGIDDIGIGVLYGLYDYRFETLALLSHIQYLEKKFNVGPHTISVPRIEPAQGVDFKSPYMVSDREFKKIVAVLRIAVPYTGIILSTRETAVLRDELFSLGISQVSAGSRTAPGGYSAVNNNAHADVQFTIGDQRGLDEVIGSLIEKGFIPSFCTACYRSSRTGEAFMNLAKPGIIKGKCSVNALITLKEYLDDFASEKVRRLGYALIRQLADDFDEGDKVRLTRFFEDIDRGIRDVFV